MDEADKKQVSTLLQSGRSNSEIAYWLSRAYSGEIETLNLETGDIADYRTTAQGIELEVMDAEEKRLATARRVTLRNSGKNMRKKFCSTRLLRMPLMRWASRSCPRSKSCRRSTRNCWKKRKRPMPSTGVPVRKCGSF